MTDKVRLQVGEVVVYVPEDKLSIIVEQLEKEHDNDYKLLVTFDHCDGVYFWNNEFEPTIRDIGTNAPQLIWFATSKQLDYYGLGSITDYKACRDALSVDVSKCNQQYTVDELISVLESSELNF